jgi:hypothetical protein
LNQIRPRLVQGEIGARADPTEEDETMESHISLTGVLVAALMFAVTVAMH